MIELHGDDCERGVRGILTRLGYRFYGLDGAALADGEPLPHQVVAKAER